MSESSALVSLPPFVFFCRPLAGVDGVTPRFMAKVRERFAFLASRLRMIVGEFLESVLGLLSSGAVAAASAGGVVGVCDCGCCGDCSWVSGRGCGNCDCSWDLGLGCGCGCGWG